MKRLADLLQDLPEVSRQLPTASRELAVTGIAYDSRRVVAGNLFVAIKGFRVSGEEHVTEAVQCGAKAVVSDTAVTAGVSGAKLPAGVVPIRVENPRRFLAQVSRRFYDAPDRLVKLIGITGTNGKTTTAHLVHSILAAAGERSGLIGTIRHFDGQEWVKAVNTTPESLDLVRMLARMRDLGVGYCVAEVSSHAIVLDRVADLEFRVGVFTNFSQDHLDFHHTMAEYKAVKLRFFQSLDSQAWAVYNIDDPVGAEVAGLTRAQRMAYTIQAPDSKSRAPSPMLDSRLVTARVTAISASGTELELSLPDTVLGVRTALVGRHNAYNILAAASAAQVLGIPPGLIKEGIERLKAVPGRLERVENRTGLSVFVDYAHSPDALACLIRAARALLDAGQMRTGRSDHKVIVVFGAGGDRDKSKRPLMGRVATELADKAVITSDNPRGEDPNEIIDNIVAGAVRENYEVVADRREAIKRALTVAHKGDIVLIAGKGHEDYQIIGQERRHFDDRETARAILDAR